MTPSRLLSLAILLAAVAGAAPVQAENRSQLPIQRRDPHDLDPETELSRDEALTHTDDQFAALARGASDNNKKRELVTKTQEFFNKAIKNLPSDTKFRGAQINGVGDIVGDLLQVVEKWENDDRNAVTQEDRTRAARDFQKGFARFQQRADIMTASMIVAPRGGPGARGETEHRNNNSENPQTRQFLDPAKTAAAGTPQAPTIQLRPIIQDAVNQAQASLPPEPPVPPAPGNGGGATGGPTGGPTGGTGASTNGPGSNGGSSGPTLGQLMGIDNPNSPVDALTDARQRARVGDYAGGIADATRAINLGAGADAYALRGGLQLDQKNLAAARADASRALELDSSNHEAMAVLHLAQTGLGVAAPKAPSFGGSADAGGVPAGGVPAGGTSSLALLNAAQPQLSVADLKREVANALRLNDLPAALSYLNRALALEPNNPALLNLRAAIYARQQDYDKAAADAKAGLALAPRNAVLLKTLAYAQLRGKHPKEALASANELLALNPADAYALALRAHAEGDMGERDAMMADINRAAALDSRYAATAADLAKLTQLPSDSDALFLFPGEAAPSAAKKPAPSGRGRAFGLLVGASVLGGLLLALGLLTTVLAPLKERVTSAFTRITRSGAAAANETAPPASVNGLMPGLIRGQYEISRQIGAGGMGMVFAGTDRSLGRAVAIKKMREELRVNPAERARFVIEAKTVAALHHPSIVDIYAIAEDGADVYLIFEFVDGKTVHDLVQAAGRLPLAEAARVTRAAADALDYAHAHGVIHRDMKPSNVMIDGSGRVKVMDFGIARMAKDSMTRYSMTNTVVGTPPYMAPEQEQGHVRRESDVYSLAVCAYEMLTGKLPFIGIGAGMLMNKINMSYVAPSRATAGMPEALDPVFAKAFQADPDKRYRTPKEFADALESALPSAARA